MASLEEIATLLDQKLEPIHEKLGKIDELKADFEDFKVTNAAELNKQAVDIQELQAATAGLSTDMKAQGEDYSRLFLLKEYYDKRYNFLIFGIPDNQDYEKKTQSLHLVRTYLREALQFPDWENIYIRDCHRLPQQKKQAGVLTRNQQAQTPSKPRPIVVRLGSVLEKAQIFECCGNLTDYNAEITDVNERVFINDHLPKSMATQKKALLPKYKRAKLQGKRPLWKVDTETGDFCLYIDGKRIQ